MSDENIYDLKACSLVSDDVEVLMSDRDKQTKAVSYFYNLNRDVSSDTDFGAGYLLALKDAEQLWRLSRLEFDLNVSVYVKRLLGSDKVKH